MLSTICFPFQKLRQIIKRNPRTSLIASLSLAGVSSYWIYTKVQPAITEIYNALKMMEDMDAGMKVGPAQRWEEGFLLCLEISRTTMHGCGVELRNQILKIFDLKSIQKTLKQQSKGSRDESDYEMWHQFKVIGFAQTFAPLYCLSLLNFLIKIQVSIVQRYNADDPSKKPSNEAFKAYLSTSRYFLTEGVAVLCNRIKAAIEQCPAFDTDLKDKWTLEMLQNATNVVRADIESVFQEDQDESYDHFLNQVLFPWSSAEGCFSMKKLTDQDIIFLDEIIAETSMLLRKPVFRAILRKSLDSCFEVYLDVMQRNLFVEINDEVRLAKLIGPTVKVFNVLLPPSPSPPAPAQMLHATPRRKSSSQVHSQDLLEILHGLVEVHDFCRVIYFPMDVEIRNASEKDAITTEDGDSSESFSFSQILSFLEPKSR